MKENRISLLLLLSLSLLLLAFVGLFIWGFSFYRQQIKDPMSSTIIVKDSSAIATGIRDSLQKLYSGTIGRMNEEMSFTRRNVDSFQVSFDARLAEFNKLKLEISEILDNRNSSTGDLATARRKIEELQQQIGEWQNRYNAITQENKRLQQLLAQMKNEPSAGNSPRSGGQITSAAANNVSSAAPSLSDLHFKAIRNAEEGGRETSRAIETDKLMGSLAWKCAGASAADEIYVVVLQPDGSVMKQSAWDMGMFETSKGRKMYSLKLRFDNVAGETRKLQFSLPGENYQKGNYILQVYHNGKMVAQSAQQLS